jgi:hypothetical protein
MNREGMPPKWIERLQEMSPQEQERFLENNRRFQSMTPQRQAQIRERLRLWNSLSPQQQEAMRQRTQIWEKMSPEERRDVQQVILPQWRSLPPFRKQVLIQKLQQLQPLDDASRRKRLNNPDFVQGLSPDEQNLLREMSKLKVGPGGGM